MDTFIISKPRPPQDPVTPKRLRTVAVAVFLLLVVAALGGLIPRWRARAALKLETAQLSVPTVLVVHPSPSRPGEGLLLPAEIRAITEAPIYARASGYLKRWLVDIGAKVQEGDLLAEIDTPELNQELARARAELLQAQAALELAKTTAARWSELLKTSSVSEQETAEKTADLSLKSATVEAAQAAVRRLEDLQSFSHVVAPFSGTITSRRTDVGELIAAGSGKELFRLAQTGTLRVYVRVPQAVVPAIIPGQTAELLLPESPGHPFTAKIIRTSGAIDAQSRTLLTELQVDNPRDEILSGSFAQVRFSQAKFESRLTVPSNSLLFRAEGPQVGVVQAGGKVELRSVTLGRDFGASVEIVDGLKGGEDVILNPSDSLSTGQMVRTLPAEKETAKQ